MEFFWFFLCTSPGPNNDPRQDQGSWRPHPNEREGDRNEPQRFDLNDPRTRHPHDLSSRGFRRGGAHGRGHDSPSHHGPEMEGPNQRSHPFLNKLSSRGFKSGTQGMHENRDPRWGGSSNEPPQGRGPEEPPGECFIFDHGMFISFTCLVHKFITIVLSRFAHSLPSKESKTFPFFTKFYDYFQLLTSTLISSHCRPFRTPG